MSNDVDVGLAKDRPFRRHQRGENWHRLLGPVFEMVQFEAARGRVTGSIPLALIAGLYLKPKVEERTAFSNSLAVKVDPDVCIGSNRPNETFTAESAHH